MSAPEPMTTEARIAALIGEALGDNPPVSWDFFPDPDAAIDQIAAHVAAALAPILAADRAETLRDAARELPGFSDIRTHGDAAHWLRERADRAGAEGKAS